MPAPINQLRLSSLSTEDRARLLRRSETDIAHASEIASRLIADVLSGGDAALSRHLADIDRVTLAPDALAVTAAEFDAAQSAVDPNLRAAIDHAIRNVRAFHRAQLPPEVTWHEVEPGVHAGEKITPIDAMGLYVPRGKGAFPSVLIMLAVPAVEARVPQISVCTPPNPDGTVDAATLYAARQIGIDRIYKIGGASAIAALAFGTATIPRVNKLLGPGNQFCSAAKRLLSSEVDVGLPAGPSESIILADAHADPNIVALDLLIEAEHGPDSAAVLVTPSDDLAAKVADLLPALIADLPEPRRTFCATSLSTYGGIVVADSFDDAIDFVNEYAPEHMELLVAEPFAVLPRIRNAGEILLGSHTPISAGNYCIGVNAILPTGGFAKSHSCTTVHSFLKRTSLAYCTREGFESLRTTAATLADYEGFPAHAAAIKNRP
jgi:histidinol dehydrogenase